MIRRYAANLPPYAVGEKTTLNAAVGSQVSSSTTATSTLAAQSACRRFSRDQWRTAQVSGHTDEPGITAPVVCRQNAVGERSPAIPSVRSTAWASGCKRRARHGHLCKVTVTATDPSGDGQISTITFNFSVNDNPAPVSRQRHQRHRSAIARSRSARLPAMLSAMILDGGARSRRAHRHRRSMAQPTTAAQCRHASFKRRHSS